MDPGADGAFPGGRAGGPATGDDPSPGVAGPIGSAAGQGGSGERSSGGAAADAGPAADARRAGAGTDRAGWGMDGLSLLSLAWDGDARVITTHDVIRDYARNELGLQRLAELNHILVDAAAVGVPLVGPLVSADREPGAAWWEPGAGGRDHPGL